jgi:hypothetical protein
MERPHVERLFIHDAVVKNDQGDLGECESWDVDNSGGENDLASGVLVGLLVPQVIHLLSRYIPFGRR